MSKGKLWTARIMSIVGILFLAFDSIGKILRTQVNLQGFAAMGFDPKFCLPVGVILFACLIVYMISRTAFMGALLLTAYLGGATAVNVLTHSLPLALGIALPVVTCIFLWAGLYVASSHLRALVFRDIRS